MQNTQEEHDEEDQQKDYEARSQKPPTPHWSSARKKLGRREKDDGIKERFPQGKVSCASDYDQCTMQKLKNLVQSSQL